MEVEIACVRLIINGIGVPLTVIGVKKPLVQPSLTRRVPRLIKPIVLNVHQIVIVPEQHQNVIRTLSIVQGVIIIMIITLVQELRPIRIQ